MAKLLYVSNNQQEKLSQNLKENIVEDAQSFYEFARNHSIQETSNIQEIESPNNNLINCGYGYYYDPKIPFDPCDPDLWALSPNERYEVLNKLREKVPSLSAACSIFVILDSPERALENVSNVFGFNFNISTVGTVFYDPTTASAVGDALSGYFFATLFDGIGSIGKGMPNAGVELGTSFGKAGILVENPSIKVNWDSFAEHGLERMVQRGVTPGMVDSWVANGKALQQGTNKYLFITKEGAAVVTKEGKLVTTYSVADFDENMINIVQQLFGE